jgi:hypothetical protein
LPAKGLTARRGFGWAHQKLRERVKRAVQAGGVRCARCGKPIAPQQHWYLDHTDDRIGYRGASHRRCNRATATHAAAARRAASAPALTFFNT